MITIEGRFRGPTESGNGGVSCGLIAAQVDAEVVEVTLRAPPPLDTELDVRVTDGGVEVHHGDVLVATARPSALDLAAPPPVLVADAEAAVAGYRLRQDHPYPECFVCGTQREAGDGLRIHPGPVAGRSDVVAAPWVPDASLADESGTVRPEIVWGALDCPSSLGLGADAPVMLLGRLTARIARPPRIGERIVALGYETAPRDGRKLYGGSALYTESGELLGVGRAIWIAVKPS